MRPGLTDTSSTACSVLTSCQAHGGVNEQPVGPQGGQAPCSVPALPSLRDDGLFTQTGIQTWLPLILDRGDHSHGGVLCGAVQLLLCELEHDGAAMGCRGEEKHRAGNGDGDEKQEGGGPWHVYI